MPAKKKSKKIYPVTTLDPNLEAQFRYTVEFYTTGKGEVIAHPGIQDVIAEMVPKAMEAQLKMIDSYKQGAMSPTLQKQFVATLKKVIRRYPTS